MIHRLHPDDIQSISEQLADRMTDKKHAYWIEPEAHARDHDLVGLIREEREEARQLRRKIMQSAAIWAVIILLGWLAVTMWDALSDSVRAGGGGP